jgi:hypothetical protein
MEQNKTLEAKEEYKPWYLQQLVVIQGLTGKDEQDILEMAKKKHMDGWLLNFLCKYYGENEEEVLSGRKFRTLVRVRKTYSYFMKRKLGYSLPETGKRLGGRDHTTILGVLRKIEEEIRDNEEFRHEMENLWGRAVSEFEDYVKKENKQINQKAEIITTFDENTSLQ